jgi:hypothetical protein
LATSVANVAINPLPAHRRGQHLTQRTARAMAHRLRQTRPPPRDDQRIQLADRHIAEYGDRLTEVLTHPAMTGRPTLVLLREHVDQLTQRRLRAIERSKAGLAQLVVENLLASAFVRKPPRWRRTPRPSR